MLFEPSLRIPIRSTRREISALIQDAKDFGLHSTSPIKRRLPPALTSAASRAFKERLGEYVALLFLLQQASFGGFYLRP